MTIAVDFDGTCVTHEYPKIGKDIGAISVLKELVYKGHKLILFTMRSNLLEIPNVEGEVNLKKDVGVGNYLDEAVEWFKQNEIELYGVNINPTQHKWTKSPKAYAELYIDDAALFTPLKYNKNISERPFVDWEKIEKELKNKMII